MSDADRQLPRLVALTGPPGYFSGLNDAVLEQLSAKYNIVKTIDGVHIPRISRIWMLTTTVRLSRPAWFRTFYEKLGRHMKKPETLRKRIRYCENRLGRIPSPYDLIFQFGALYGVLKRPDVPLVIMADFTTRLAERFYPEWLPTTAKETQEWYAIEEQLYRGADLVVVATERVRESMIEDYGVSPENVATVGMGVHVYQRLNSEKHPSHLMLFAGMEFERHGGTEALRIFSALRARLPDARLSMLTNISNIPSDSVENLGVVSRARLGQLLNEAAVLIMPGRVGGYQTVTEAMWAKCVCVVAEDNPHMTDLLRDCVVLGHRASDLERTVQSVLDKLRTPVAFSSFGNAAQKYVERHCLWSQVVGRIDAEMRKRFNFDASRSVGQLRRAMPRV